MEKIKYSKWQPALSPEDVFSDAVSYSEVRTVGSKIYWLEARPQEKGRVVLVCDGKDITSNDFNLRTRVHEYGGGVYAVDKEYAYFVNHKDQRMYRLDLKSKETIPLTSEKNKDGSLGKYASLEVFNNLLLFVYEKEYLDKENINCIAILDLSVNGEREPEIIVAGNDFYSHPVFSADGTKIAWLTWNHPNMPWDTTELYTADIEKCSIRNIIKVAGGAGYSICNPKFSSNGILYFIMDKKGANETSLNNWWNLYRYDGKIQAITKETAEFSGPHWTFGSSYFDFVKGGIICSYIKKGLGHLGLIKEGKLFSLMENIEPCRYIRNYDDTHVVMIYASPTDNSTVCKVNVKTQKRDTLSQHKQSQFDKQDIALPKIISYPTRNGPAFAKFYLPKNHHYEGIGKPMLLVMVHGGPTSSAHVSLSLAKQFWTSQGYAILDVDYHGSTGYGRKYRDALLLRWGDIDAYDIADGVHYLIDKKLVDKNNVFIRGGSAGGYAVQRMLTLFPDMFKAGASYYGIGRLASLVEDTHKFESRYLDMIIAPYPIGKAVYEKRSPLNHLDKLRSPMIIFQGSDDKIVPPRLSREVADKLKDKGIKYEYHEYAGEAHGFRMKESNIDSLTKEAEFFRSI